MKNIFFLLLVLFSQNLVAGNSPDRSDLVVYWLASNDSSEGVSLGFVVTGEAFEVELKGCDRWWVQGNSLQCVNGDGLREIATVSSQIKQAGGDLGFPAYYREVQLNPRVSTRFKSIKSGNFIRSWTLEVLNN